MAIDLSAVYADACRVVEDFPEHGLPAPIPVSWPGLSLDALLDPDIDLATILAGRP